MCACFAVVENTLKFSTLSPELIIIPALAGFQRGSPPRRFHHVSDSFSSARKSQRADPKRERSGRSGVFLAIKTAQDEVSQEIKTCHIKIPMSYKDLD